MERADPSDITFLSLPNRPQRAVMLPTVKVLLVGAAPISSGCSLGLAHAGLPCAVTWELGGTLQVPALPSPLSSLEGPSLPCSPGPAHKCGEVLPPAVAPGASAPHQALLPHPLPTLPAAARFLPRPLLSAREK